MTFNLNNRKVENVSSYKEGPNFIDDLRRKVYRDFPPITDATSFARSKYLGSFDITNPNVQPILIAVLDRASNPEDIIISHHALLHPEAVDVAKILKKAVINQQLSWEMVQCTDKETGQTVNRLKLSTPYDIERTLPEAVIEACWLLHRDDSQKFRNLQMIAKESGYDVALLASAFLNLPSETVMEKVFRRDALPHEDMNGILLPRADDRNACILYNNLRRIVCDTDNKHKQIPNLSTAAYDAAVRRMDEERRSGRWRYDTISNMQKFDVRIPGEAMALLPTLMSRAGKLAQRDVEGEQLRRIQSCFRNEAATSFITAYIKHDYHLAKLAPKMHDGPKVYDDTTRSGTPQERLDEDIEIGLMPKYF